MIQLVNFLKFQYVLPSSSVDCLIHFIKPTSTKFNILSLQLGLQTCDNIQQKATVLSMNNFLGYTRALDLMIHF